MIEAMNRATIDSPNTFSGGDVASFDSALNRASAWQGTAIPYGNDALTYPDIGSPVDDGDMAIDEDSSPIDENEGHTSNDPRTEQLQKEVADLRAQVDQLTQACTLLLQHQGRGRGSHNAGGPGTRSPIATVISNVLLGGGVAAAIGAKSAGEGAGPIFGPLGALVGGGIGGLLGGVVGGTETAAVGVNGSQDWVEKNGVGLLAAVGGGKSGGSI